LSGRRLIQEKGNGKILTPGALVFFSRNGSGLKSEIKYHDGKKTPNTDFLFFAAVVLLRRFFLKGNYLLNVFVSSVSTPCWP